MADGTPPVPGKSGGADGVTEELKASFEEMIRKQADIAIAKNKLAPPLEATRTFK